ncbi:biopolymer transporter ExbD [uncultured Dokdonia sp.]|uniref:ExbD/TolR family protein n=1 Tax=uncultured Dokdonia sp. TaxID=575653 RepID=UPI0026054A02|nr:biopolymer transporter ExbD [uncultured Dokdonia sp.]
MKIICIAFCFFCVSIFNAQVKSIELPEGEQEVKITRVTPVLSFYIDKLENIYLEKERITLNNIALKLDQAIKTIPEQNRLRTVIFLYIDKQTPYSTVDKLKTEIASLDVRKIVYKMGSIEDKDFLKGIYWKNYPKYNAKKMSEESTAEIPTFVPMAKSISTKKTPPSLPPLHWTYLLEKDMYSNQKQSIDKALSDRTISCITATNKGIVYNSELIRLEDNEALLELFTSYNALFIDFDEDLSYDSYIETVKSFKEIYKLLERSKKKAFVVELSSQIKAIHNESKINFCKSFN